jgi:tetratricopeptide (TPR) repeat protein
VLDYYLQGSLILSRSIDAYREDIPIPPGVEAAMAECGVASSDAVAWFESEYQAIMAAISRAAQEGLEAYAWQTSWAIENALSRSGRWQAMTSTHRVALEAAARIGDLTGQAHALRGLGRACSMLGDPDEGLFHLKRALELFNQLGDSAAHARTPSPPGHCGEQLGPLQ